MRDRPQENRGQTGRFLKCARPALRAVQFRQFALFVDHQMRDRPQGNAEAIAGVAALAFAHQRPFPGGNRGQTGRFLNCAWPALPAVQFRQFALFVDHQKLDRPQGNAEAIAGVAALAFAHQCPFPD